MKIEELHDKGEQRHLRKIRRALLTSSVIPALAIGAGLIFLLERATRSILVPHGIRISIITIVSTAIGILAFFKIRLRLALLFVMAESNKNAYK